MKISLEKFYQYYDMEISVCDGKRKEFLQAMKLDLKPCKVVPLKTILNDYQIERIKRIVEAKQCFKNAYHVAELIESMNGNAKYVDGRVLVADFLPIEHAWNKVGDFYIDATFELCLGHDVTKENYALLQEYNVSEVREVLLERQYYGEIYREKKANEFFKNYKK